MSERERMLAGELYDPADPELVALRRRARGLVRAYNASTEEQPEERVALLRQLFGSLGARPEVEPPFYCDYGAHVHAGERLFMNFGCTILDVAEVWLGDDVFLGPQVQLLAATHPLDAAARVAGREYGRSIRIGSRVWLGGGVIVCPGVTIGDDTTIGAGSVVAKDIPANVLAVGNPCRVVRTLA